MPTAKHNHTDADHLNRAVNHLRSADPRLADIVKRVGECKIQVTRDPYVTLLASIIHQQLSMKAAATIRGRVKQLCTGGRITPIHIAAVSDESLRACGLSKQKLSYVRDLTEHFASGKLTARALRRMDDDQAIEAVTEIRGIGRWTAEMLLMFCLERPDVWPIDDLGLQKAVQRMLAKRSPLKLDKLHAAGEPLRPYRTYATWYLWRSLEGPVSPGMA